MDLPSVASRAWRTHRAVLQQDGQAFGNCGGSTEFTSIDFKQMLTEFGVKVEYTPPDGVQRNGRVERKFR